MAQNNRTVFRVVETDEFQQWIRNLRNRQARDRINTRLSRVRQGNFGDTDSLGGGLYEMRIHYGPGYRIYFIREGMTVVVLLCGGDKDTQPNDISRARRLAVDWRVGNA